jgi:leucyl-tRNA synthetase
MPRYNPAVLEPKWQTYWDQHKTFASPQMPVGKKCYVLDMFPYPSGDGLHVGHPEGYTATDIVCRAARMQGRSVLHPMGFDAFGLPAEEHAIKTGQHPRIQTEQNIANFRRQLKMLGFSYDWDRELATTDLNYIHWTQWIFLQLYDTWFDQEHQRGKPIDQLPIPEPIAAESDEAVIAYQDQHRLAYQSDAPVNWCPALGTVLANEEVIDGKSERGGHPVVRRPLRQWMLRITAYAERLEKDLEGVDWPTGVKTLQRNWIGRSTGAEVKFIIQRAMSEESREDVASRRAGSGPIFGQPSLQSDRRASRKLGPDPFSETVIWVYTTRPDTLFGATYMVLAPEHPLVERLTTAENQQEVATYREKAAAKSDLDRTDLAKDKSGVFTGSYAVNPVNNQPIPIWIADYVLISYGTGAIMAVPAHDQRDFEFAQQYGIDIKSVVEADPNATSSHSPKGPPKGPPKEDPDKTADDKDQVFTGAGIAINSGEYNGLTTEQFKQKITAWLEAQGHGHQAVNYKLRDWLFSRQRFWGEPFPLLHELNDQRKPTGHIRPLEAKDLPLNLPHLEDFKPHGRPEPPLDSAPDEWLYPVIDGTTYKRETNTMPQWAGSCWYYLRFLDPNNEQALIDPEIEQAWMPIDLYVGGAEHAVLHLLYARFWHKVLFDRGLVSTLEPFHKLVNQGMILGQDGGKMSKSRGNVVNPDEVVAEYGADSLRLYEMFMGPLVATKPWSMDGVNGVHSFLHRVWRMIVDEKADELILNSAVTDERLTQDQTRVLHKTIQTVTQDIAKLEFNTAIARMMEFTNFFTKQDTRPREAMEKLVLLLSPYAPHLAEELWQLLGHSDTLAYEPWPEYDEALIAEDELEIPVQINGKVRSKIRVPAGADQGAIEAAARNDPRIVELLAGKQVVKTVVVPGRLVNFVTR